MPELSVRREVAAKFFEYVEAYRGDKHPHDFIHDLLEEGIAALRTKNPFVKNAPVMDATFGTANDKVVYRGNLEAASNDVLIHTGLTSRRKVLREAIIAFCMLNNLIYIRENKMIISDVPVKTVSSSRH